MADRLLFIDTETTTGWYGDAMITEVVEIGWILTENDQIIEEGQSFISPLVPINSYTEWLIEISNDMVKGAPQIHEYFPSVVERSTGAIVIGHNTLYDLRVIDQSLGRRGHVSTPWYQEFNNRPYLDTMHLMSKVVPEAPSRKLKTLMQLAGLDPQLKKHRALADSQFTKDGFFWLWPKLQNHYKVDSVSDLVLAYRGMKPTKGQVSML